MRIMTETTNGFAPGGGRFKMRGSGEILEPESTGLPEFPMADIIEDFPIFRRSQKGCQLH